MKEYRNQDEDPQSCGEATGQGALAPSRTRSGELTIVNNSAGKSILLDLLSSGEGVPLDSEGSRALVAGSLPNVLVNAAISLNEMIYTGCEGIECRDDDDYEDDDDGDFSLLENSLGESGTFDGTFDDTYDETLDETLDGTMGETVETNTLEGTLEETVEKSVDTSPSEDKSNASRSTVSKKIPHNITSKIVSVSSLNLQPILVVPVKNSKEKPAIIVESKTEDTSVLSGDQSSKNVSVTYVTRQLEQTGLEVLPEKIPVHVTVAANDENQSGSKTRISSQEEEQRKRPEGSLRKMRRSISKFIRPSKTKHNEDGKGDHSTRSSRSCIVDKEEVAEKEENHSSRSQQPEEKETNRSYRARSILDDKKTVSKERNFSGRLFRRSIGFGPDDDMEKKKHPSKSSKKTLTKKKRHGKKSTGGKKEAAETLQKPQYLPKVHVLEGKKSSDSNSLEVELGKESFIMASSSLRSSAIGGGGDRYTPHDDYDVLPSFSTHLTSVSTNPSSAMAAADSYVLLEPNNDGQEIALQEDNYYFHDPAQVHSLLTMPTFEESTSAMKHRGAIQNPLPTAIQQ